MRDFHQPGRSAVFAENGMCATSHPLAAQTAIDILKRGGNAMDAAVAGAVLLGICEPQMAGLGGDCFVLFSPAGTDDVHGFNGSGRAAAGASAQALRKSGFAAVPIHSADAVTIPGSVDAFCTLAADWGKLGLDALLAPAIQYAENGVPVAPRVAFDWQEASQFLQGAGRTFYLNNGQVPKVGEVFRNPTQADVLRRIAKNGRDAFYSGEIAEDMVATLQAIGGQHDLDDFADTRGTATHPISATYKGVELLEHPPNGQGATAMLLLNVLSHFDISSMDPNGFERAHIEAEATKLAYDARNRILADTDHTTHLERMLSTDVAAELASLISRQQAMPSAPALTEAIHKDTVYITVVDRDRMSVSLIYSIFHGFGSGIASEKFGVLFHNRGAGFSLTDGHPNELAGGKRPMHTIIPGMLRQGGRVTMPFGVMGGAYQPCGHARFISNMVDFGMDPQSAIDTPRCFADAGVLRTERGYSARTKQALSDLGHILEEPHTPIGGAQAIHIDDKGVLTGASDFRKDGCAIGY